MQHFRIQKKRFPFLKFGAKAIEYTVRPSEPAVVTRLHSYGVTVNLLGNIITEYGRQYGSA